MAAARHVLKNLPLNAYGDMCVNAEQTLLGVTATNELRVYTLQSVLNNPYPDEFADLVWKYSGTAKYNACCFGQSDVFFACNTTSGCVEAFARNATNGTFVVKLSLIPKAITVHEGVLYVSQNIREFSGHSATTPWEGNTVRVEDGVVTHTMQFPSKKFQFHSSIAVKFPYVFITDCYNDRIGTFCATTGVHLSDLDLGFFSPRGLCVLSDDSFLVASGCTHLVMHIRDSINETCYGKFGDWDVGKLRSPSAVACVRGVGVLVREQGNAGRVQLFLDRWIGSPLSAWIRAFC